MNQYCRICFAFDVKMHKFGDTAEREFIESVFKQQGYNRSMAIKSTVICYICDALLAKSYNFIARAMRAQQLFEDFMEENDLARSINMLQYLDRCKFNLNYTNLSINTINIGSIEEYECLIKKEIDADQNNPNSKIGDDDDHVYNDISSDLGDNINSVKSVKENNKVENNEREEIEINLADPLRDNNDSNDTNDPLNVDHKTNIGSVDEHEGSIKNDNRADENNSNHKIPDDNTKNDSDENAETEEIEINLEGPFIDDIDAKNMDDPLNVDTPKEYDALNTNTNLCKPHCINNEYTERAGGTIAVVNKITKKPQKTSRKTNKKTAKKIHSQNINNKIKKKIKMDREIIIIDSDSTESKDDKRTKRRKKRKKINDHKKTKLPTRNRIPTVKHPDLNLIIDNKRKRNTPAIVDTDSEGSETIKKKYRKPESDADEDYVPADSTDSESDREYPRTCRHCDSLISSKMEHFHHHLEFHPKIMYPYVRTGPLYVCEICGVKKNNYNHFQSHLLTHGERKVQCEQCSKMYHSKVQMTQHVTRVHLPKKFVCDYCGKRFPDKGAVKLHIRIHTGHKPYKCHICGAGFAHGGNRLLHIRVKHQNRPYPLQEKQQKLNQEALNQKTLNQESPNQKKKTKKIRKPRKGNKEPESDDDTLATISKRRKKITLKNKNKKSRERRDSILDFESF